MNTIDKSSPSFSHNFHFKEGNLKLLQIWKVEYQNFHFQNLKNCVSLGRKAHILLVPVCSMI